MISILTPTYNHEKFISVCIESVLAQTYKHWEMIIIDDGSTDRTGDVVALYKDDRIKYIRQESKGINRLSETYNTALSIAKGDYIAILEGDDYWPYYKLDVQAADFEDSKVILSFGHTQVISCDGKPIGLIPMSKLPVEAETNNPVGRSSLYMMDPSILTFLFPVSVVICKAALERIGGFQQLPYLPVVDYPTFMSLTREGNFIFHDKILGFWRRHEQSTTRNKAYLILDGVYKYITAFQLEKDSQLPISKKEFGKIKLKWNRFNMIRWLLLGRWCLVDGEWEKASMAFKKGLMLSCKFPFSVVLKLFLRLGIILSYLHIPIELLPRLIRYPIIYKLRTGDGKDMIISKDMIEKL